MLSGSAEAAISARGADELPEVAIEDGPIRIDASIPKERTVAPRIFDQTAVAFRNDDCRISARFGENPADCCQPEISFTDHVPEVLVKAKNTSSTLAT